MTDDANLRTQLAKLLDWDEAHVGFDATVKGIPPRLRGIVPPGWQYSAWQLVEHLRISQDDILDFCVNPRYRPKRWPDDYWPKSPGPPRTSAWIESIAGFRRDRKRLQRLAADEKIDLFAAIPHGTGQTYLREILLAADHGSYHVGQIVALRRQLGVWK